MSLQRLHYLLLAQLELNGDLANQYILAYNYIKMSPTLSCTKIAQINSHLPSVKEIFKVASASSQSPVRVTALLRKIIINSTRTVTSQVVRIPKHEG